MKKNCWEIKKCGREANGVKASELGVCPAALPSKYDGFNEGSLGGRYCWKIAGTFCGGEVQGTFADKLLNCVECNVFKMIKAEQGASFRP